MKSHRVHKKEKRRGGSNKITKYINCASLVGWIAAFISIWTIYAAKPGYYWDRKQVSSNPYSWDLDLVRWYCIFMFVCLIASVTGLVINKQQVRRKDDTYRFNLIILAVLSTLSIIGYFIKF